MEFLSQIHPRIVHFPIVFFISYFFFETSGIIFNKDYLQKSAFIILIAGVLTALLAVLTGNQAHAAAEIIIGKNNSLNEIIAAHENFATVTVWYFSGILVFRTYLMAKKKKWNSTSSGNTAIKILFVILGLIGCYLIYITGIYGGDLVFQHGIGTRILSR